MPKELRLDNGDVVDAETIPPRVMQILEAELTDEQLTTVIERMQEATE